jgi:hypothetical protein
LQSQFDQGKRLFLETLANKEDKGLTIDSSKPLPTKMGLS